MGKEVVIPFVSGINSTGFCSCLCFCRPIQVVIPFVSGINSTDFLAKGDDVAIIGFGTFRLTERAARTGRNPKTGKKMKIPGYKTVTFKVSKNIKEMLNGK